MAALVLLRNPLTPHTREIFEIEAGTPVIDWLQEHHPNGFGMPIRFYVNGDEKELDDLDHRVADDDVVAIALMPAEPVTLITIGVGLLISAALSVVTYFAMKAFMPKEKSGKKDSPTSVYEISSDQNAARIGEAIPVVYGEVLTTPDYVSQPYTWFSWSQTSLDSVYNGVQYLDLILCVGQGNIDVEDVIVGDTDSKTLDAGVLSWNAFKPAQHQNKMGVIAAVMGANFHESVISSPEVSNQEFVTTDDDAGFFASCPPGHKGSIFQIDIIFPAGATDPINNGQDLYGRTTQFNVEYVELDDLGAQVGAVTVIPITCSTRPNASVTGPTGLAYTTSGTSTTNRTIISSPIRRSYMFTAPRSARWAVRLVRKSIAPNAVNGVDRFIWAGLKLYEDYKPGKVYGDVTLVACRIKASQGLGSDASVRVKVRATRRLTPPDGGSEVQTTSGVDAFADVYSNTVYGASRPAAELDLTTLMDLRTRWANYKFNYVFRNRTTVWDALRTITTPFGAEPSPIGAVMSIAQDGVKPMRSMLFTDANIVAGSMTINYSFDEDGAADGVEIEYLNPVDFRQSYALWPASSLQPDRFALPGVTDATQAQQYARLTWQRRTGQRKSIVFDTELEGLILHLGDRIGIAHNVPKWGDSGLVVGSNGNELLVDHDLDWSGSTTKYILLRRTDGSVTEPIPVSRGAQDNVVVMATPHDVNFDNHYEYTSFAFGSANTMVRDFIVTSVRPNDQTTVTIEAVNYNPAIYDGAMTHMVA